MFVEITFQFSDKRTEIKLDFILNNMKLHFPNYAFFSLCPKMHNVLMYTHTQYFTIQ